MPTVQIPTEYMSVAPLIVTSPTTRCGTTLLQRLLATADNGFVFGETIGGHFSTLTEMLAGEIHNAETTAAISDAAFENALKGDMRNWHPTMAAPSSVMLQAMVATYYQMPKALEAYMASLGRPIWGFKFPAYSCRMIKLMMSVMPNAKVIYVFRNLFDVLKSAKARKFVKSPEDVREFCADWSNKMNEITELANEERVLFVKYESLMAQPDDHIQLLQLFTGLASLDPATFDIKINTLQGDAENGHSPTQYIEPATLTGADRAAIVEKAGPVMRHLYGDLMKAA
jgi:hypothetical protein